MPGQSPHVAYLPFHTGHGSFNAAPAAAESSHMQFQGLYHPPRPATMANPHHWGSAMEGNIGVSVAAVTQELKMVLITYQQPQLCHQNWNGSF